MGRGGYCAALHFWWQVPWTDLGAEVVQGISDKTIHANVLELLAIVINFFAAAAAFAEKDMKWQPQIHCGGDNTSALAW